MRPVEFRLVQEILEVHAVFIALARPFLGLHVPDFTGIDTLDRCTALVADITNLALDFEMERTILSGVFTVRADTHVETVEELFLFPAEERPRRCVQVEVRNPVESTRSNLGIVVFFAIRRQERTNPVRPFDGDMVLQFEAF